jgi:hypothetical protein
VQLRECAPGFAGLRDIGQQRPRHGVAVQVLADADRMQFERPFAVFGRSVAIGRGSPAPPVRPLRRDGR